MVQVRYCTREDVKSALDIKAPARTNTQIDREIEAASRAIEGDLLRYFYPYEGTQTFDWPDHQYSASWRLWLDQRELTSVTQILAAGDDITADCILRPDEAPMRGRPYTKIEINLGTSSNFNSGDTFQRAIAVTGVFGYCADEDAAGTISAFASTTVTIATVSDGAAVGVGTIVRVDTERMIVTEKNMADSGQTLGADIDVKNNVNLVPVQTSTSFNQNEVIMIDAEKMRIDEIAGNNLVVTRAWDGSTLAAHTSGAAVYASRLVTVARGQLGTAASTHAADAPVFSHRVPGLIRSLAVAGTMVLLGAERRGYSQIVQGAAGTKKVGVADEYAQLFDQARVKYRRVRKRTTARLV